MSIQLIQPENLKLQQSFFYCVYSKRNFIFLKIIIIQIQYVQIDIQVVQIIFALIHQFFNRIHNLCLIVHYDGLLFRRFG